MPHPMISPWLIAESGWAAVCAVYDGTPEGRALLDELRRERTAAGLGMNGGNARALEVRDRVAVVPIAGPLFRKAGLFTDLSDATSDDKIRGDIDAAKAMAARREIDGVVLAIDSPGGEASGSEETARLIRALSSTLPVVAYTEDGAQSKAYWYAAAASHIVAAPTAMLGSIGARMRLAKDDGETIEIVSSQSPAKRGTPLDDEVIARLQVQADDLAQVFVERVAAYRGVSVDKVLADFGKGDGMIASKALAAGMADEIGNLDTALAAVRARANRKGNRMDPTTTAGAQPATGGPALADADLVKLGTFRASVLALTGDADEDAALGTLRAWKTDAGRVKALEEQQAAEAAAGRIATFRASVEAAITAKRITPAALACDLVPMLDDGNREKAEAALAALPESAGVPDQLAAVCSAVALSEGEGRRVAAYLGKRPGPVFAVAPREKPEGPQAPVSEGAAAVSKVADEMRAHLIKQMTPRGAAAAK